MINVRRANKEDCDAVWSVRTAAIKGITENFYSQFEIDTWASTSRPDNFEEVIIKLDWYVAEYDNLIVGSGFLYKDNMEIGGIFVNSQFQRKNIGLTILQRLETIARENNIKLLNLDATLNAEAFYKAAGYQSLKKGKYSHVSGLKFDCIKMEKLL